MLKVENWFEEACEYTSVPSQLAIDVVEKRDAQARKEFFQKYQKGNEYSAEIKAAREKGTRKDWMQSWGEQYYNIFKMDLIKVVHERNYTARFLLHNYSQLAAKLGRRDLDVLDFGCGSGYCCRVLLGEHPQARVDLCDVKGVVLDYAHWRCQRLNQNVGKFEITDVNPIPISKKYDIIFCYTVLEHVWDPLDIAKQFHGSLKEGGLLIETYGGKTGQTVDPEGEDCQQAWDQRDNVLAFFDKSFKRVRGSNDAEEIRVWRKAAVPLSSTRRLSNNLVNHVWSARRKLIQILKPSSQHKH